MNWKFERVEEDDYIRVVTGGTFSAEKFAAMIAGLCSLDYWKPSASVLFDNSALQFGDAGYDEILLAIDQFVSSDPSLSAIKVAVLFGSNLGFGLGSKFGENNERRIASRMDVFRNESEAVTWLTDPAGRAKV